MKKDNTLIIVLGIVLAFVLIGGLGFGGMQRDYGMMGSYWTGGFGWMWIFMILVWALGIVFLVLGILWLAKQLQKG